VPLLKGGLGSVAYFALYLYAVAGLTVGNSVYERKPDPLGVGFALREMSLAGSGTAGAGANPEPNIGVHTAPANISTFDFAGIGWDTETLLARLAWASAALIAVLAAALFFSRFDPSRRPAVPASGVVPTGFQSWLPGSLGRNKDRSAEATQARAPDPAPGTVDASSLAPLDGRSAKGRFAPLVVAELKLMLKGRSRLWYAGALGIVAAGLVVSPEDARAVVLPIAWLWPLLLWSSLGCRENRFGPTGPHEGDSRRALRRICRRPPDGERRGLEPRPLRRDIRALCPRRRRLVRSCPGGRLRRIERR
jgi:hypothetical protein